MIRTLRQSMPQRFPNIAQNPADLDTSNEEKGDRSRLELLDLVTVMFALVFLFYSLTGLWVALNGPNVNAVVALVLGAIFGTLLFVNVVGRWKRRVPKAH